MKALFITVGTSALINEDIGKPGDNTALRRDVTSFLEDPDNRMAAKNLEIRLVEAHKRACGMKGIRGVKTTSAELHSSINYMIWGKWEPHKIELICTDTAECRLAGEVNKAVFAHLYPQISVGCKHVPELASGEATPADLQALIGMVYQGADDDVRVNVTGGFKSTLVPLTVAAARKSLILFYQHENAALPVELNLALI